MKVAVAVAGVVIVGASALWASRWLWPGAANNRPKLVEARPLAPVTRSSRIIVPAVVSLTAIRDAMERAPRELSGKPNLPTGPYESSLEMNWLVSRGGFDVSADRDGLTLATTLDGSLHVSGPACRAFRARSDCPDRLRDLVLPAHSADPPASPDRRATSRSSPRKGRASVAPSSARTSAETWC